MNARRTCSALGFALAAMILAPSAAAAAPGCTWTQVSTRFSESPHLRGVWGSSPRDVWIVGAGGTIWRWNGDSFTRMVSGTTADLNTITGSGPRDVWAAGLPTQGEKRLLLHYINDWRPFSVPGQTNMAMDIHGLAIAGPGQMWLAGYSHTGDGLVYSNNNGRWIARDAGDAFRVRSVFAIAGLPRKIALSVGYIDSADPKMESRVHQFDMDTDTRTERLVARTRLHGLWASSQEDILVVGDGGAVLYAKNGAWRELTGGGTQDLRGIWGSSRTDVWIVGRGGTILHYDGDTVSPQGADIPKVDLYGVFATSATDAWAVGDSGTVLRCAPVQTMDMMPRTNPPFSVPSIGCAVSSSGGQKAPAPAGAAVLLALVFGVRRRARNRRGSALCSTTPVSP